MTPHRHWVPLSPSEEDVKGIESLFLPLGWGVELSLRGCHRPGRKGGQWRPVAPGDPHPPGMTFSCAPWRRAGLYSSLDFTQHHQSLGLIRLHRSLAFSQIWGFMWTPDLVQALAVSHFRPCACPVISILRVYPNPGFAQPTDLYSMLWTLYS